MIWSGQLRLCSVWPVISINISQETSVRNPFKIIQMVFSRICRIFGIITLWSTISVILIAGRLWCPYKYYKWEMISWCWSPDDDKTRTCDPSSGRSKFWSFKYLSMAGSHRHTVTPTYPACQSGGESLGSRPALAWPDQPVCWAAQVFSLSLSETIIAPPLLLILVFTHVPPQHSHPVYLILTPQHTTGSQHSCQVDYGPAQPRSCEI